MRYRGLNSNLAASNKPLYVETELRLVCVQFVRHSADKW